MNVVNKIWRSFEAFVGDINNVFICLRNKFCKLYWEFAIQSKWKRRLFSMCVSFVVVFGVFLFALQEYLIIWAILSAILFPCISEFVFNLIPSDSFDLKEDFMKNKLTRDDFQRFYLIIARREKAERKIYRKRMKEREEEYKERGEFAESLNSEIL